MAAWAIDKEHATKRNLPALAAPGALAQDWSIEHWVDTWGAGPGGPRLPANTRTFTDQSLRLSVHSNIGGNRVRIRV